MPDLLGGRMPLPTFARFPPHPGLDQRRHIGRVAVGIHGGGQISHIGFVRERQSLGEQLGAAEDPNPERSRPSSGIS